MADLARQMFRDCTYDLKEITQCRDCYRFATEKPNKLWYCKPCRPFHELVSLIELINDLFTFAGAPLAWVPWNSSIFRKKFLRENSSVF